MGRFLRALRRRRGWRQVDLAGAAGISQRHVSNMERGHLGGVAIGTLRRVFAALEARIEVTASWRGAELDRLLDEDHAELTAAAAARLERLGWTVETEVTYSEFGERGSLDLFATRPDLRACLVVEIKASIGSSEATVRKLDEKARLAPTICQRRYGWRPDVVGRVLVLPETSRWRRLFDADGILGRALPVDFAKFRHWLRRPDGRLAATWFLSLSSHRAARGARGARVRRRPSSPSVTKPH